MKWPKYIISGSVILALFCGLFGWLVESSTIRWAAPAFGLGIIAVGLSLASYLIASHTDRKISKMEDAVTRIECLHEEIRKEQKEQANSSSPVVTSLQAISQYYMDFLTKQKGEQNNEKVK